MRSRWHNFHLKRTLIMGLGQYTLFISSDNMPFSSLKIILDNHMYLNVSSSTAKKKSDSEILAK